ncbi:NAD(P)H-dependent oxidoreductase [Chryseobacterium sp. RG1]|uniref:NAD(P)H-dependent oxidoreductase n=1 Tax=Chryseobacterium tagetis TaxID=2801334 RepID=A0ABS8A1L0_9FLAO|nr:NAD(P)H-dependent oxidoreductase [Chryseobacterium tagetis]MCA6067879.1 NAD(P)H-dependent oxidoreductase [Chryseobacterium tagetis]
MKNIIELLTWRYATKKMTGEKISSEQINNILEAAHLAPSGIGLQPYEIIVISNPEIKKRILPIAMNQAQITESSHLLVFAVWDEYTKERIDHVFDHLIVKQNKKPDSYAHQRSFAKTFFGNMSLEENFHHAAKQANIALGLAIVAAASEGIDSTPMEGFDPMALDEFLKLSSKGLRSSMLLALGYRDQENDWNLENKKVRKPFEEFVTFI